MKERRKREGGDGDREGRGEGEGEGEGEEEGAVDCPSVFTHLLSPSTLFSAAPFLLLPHSILPHLFMLSVRSPNIFQYPNSSQSFLSGEGHQLPALPVPLLPQVCAAALALAGAAARKGWGQGRAPGWALGQHSLALPRSRSACSWPCWQPGCAAGALWSCVLSRDLYCLGTPVPAQDSAVHGIITP